MRDCGPKSSLGWTRAAALAMPRVSMPIPQSAEVKFPRGGGHDNVASLLADCLDKIILAKKSQPGLVVEVDGGVNLENANLVRNKGADVIVAGTAIFKSQDRAKAICEISNRQKK